MRFHIGLVVCLAASGCVTAGPGYDAPALEGRQDGFINADQIPEAEAQSGAPWWQAAYGDPLLAALVEDALAQNQSIAAAVARLEASDARLSAARRGLLPQGTLQGGVQRTEPSPFQFGGPTGGGGEAPGIETPIDIYSASANLSWEIDLFGRLRRQAQAAAASRDNAEALLADARRLITAQTVQGYFDWLEAASRLAVAEENLAAQEAALSLTRQLFDLGEISRFDLLRQETQTNLTRAQTEALAASRTEALAGLAVLTGRTVPALLGAHDVSDGARPDIPTIEARLAVPEPTAVLRQRPDVAAAERQIAAATYQIGVEAAALYPQISLTGEAGLTALSFDGLSEDEAFSYSYGPGISWSVFSYPRILAQKAAREAEARAALAQFEETVLTALTETEAALDRYARAQRQAGYLEAAEEGALESLSLAEARYREGADSLLTYLDAQRTALGTQDEAIVTRIGALRARAAVHRALGG